MSTLVRAIVRSLDELIDRIHWYICRRWRYPIVSRGLAQGEGNDGQLEQPLVVPNHPELVEAWHAILLSTCRYQAGVCEGSSQEYNVLLETLLQRLWNASFYDDSHALFSVKHDKWKELGFQNACPASDIRGGGLLSISCLVYMAETYPDVYRALVGKTYGIRSEYEYPFAASYIHMVFSLLDALELRDLAKINRYSYSFLSAAMHTRSCIGDTTTNSTADDDDDDDDVLTHVFEEMSVYTMVVLDEVWVSMSASYLDFPKVKKIVCRHVQRVVSKRWFDHPSLILSEFGNGALQKKFPSLVPRDGSLVIIKKDS